MSSKTFKKHGLIIDLTTSVMTMLKTKIINARISTKAILLDIIDAIASKWRNTFYKKYNKSNKVDDSSRLEFIIVLS